MINSYFDKIIYSGGLKYINNNFTVMGIPFVMIPTELLIGLSSNPDINFQKQLYLTTKKSAFKSLKTQFGIDFRQEGDKGLKIIEDFFTASGWGLLSSIDLDLENKRAIVVVNNSAIGSALKGKVKNHCDHFMRGIIAAIFQDFFNEGIDCVETECIGMNDPKCKFVVKLPHDFDFSKENVRQQLTAE